MGWFGYMMGFALAFERRHGVIVLEDARLGVMYHMTFKRWVICFLNGLVWPAVGVTVCWRYAEDKMPLNLGPCEFLEGKNLEELD